MLAAFAALTVLAGLASPTMAEVAPDVAAEIAPGAPAAAEAAPTPPAVPRQAPFITLLPWTLADGVTEISCSGLYAREEHAPFGGDRRSRAALLCDLSGGLGEKVEGWIQFGATDLIGTEEDEGIVPADLRLAFQVAVARGGDRSPAITASFVAKAPTAPDSAGTDEADLGVRVTAGWMGRRSGFFVSAGVDLLGNPRRNGSQDDVAVYGLGIWREAGSRWRLSAEIEGSAFSRFDNSAAYLRIGALWQAHSSGAGGAAAHGTVARGLNADSAEWEIRAGAGWLWP